MQQIGNLTHRSASGPRCAKLRPLSAKPRSRARYHVLVTLMWVALVLAANNANPAHRSRERTNCAGITDAREWPNPFVVVAATSVTVLSRTSRSSPPESRDMSTEELAPFLRALPKTAWPCGKVVGLSEAGVRGVHDDAIIAENLKRVKRILKRLRIRMNGWPSA